MTKTKLLIAATALLTVGFTACNSENKEAKQDAEMLNSYVDSVESATPVYTVANWTAIDNGYQERAAKAEKNMAALNAEEKAKAEASKAKYEALKAKYELAIKEAEAKSAASNATATNYKKILRDRLFGEGKIGDDMSFSFVNAANIEETYKNFINTVEDNKGNYSREDWDEIKVLYEALDSRKNTVEKEGLKGSDNLKIAAFKVKFSTIYATHRPLSKARENAEAKQ